MGEMPREPTTPRHLTTQSHPVHAWDADAFAQLYDTSARVYGVALCVVGDPTGAAEVTEQAYLELWRGRATTGSHRSSPFGALVAHAHRLGVARVRSSGTSRTHGGRPPAGEALSRLHATQRRAIELTYFCGQSQQDAARTLEISPEAVAEQVSSGLAQLQRGRAMADPR